MNTIKYINVSLEMFGSLLSLFIIFNLYLANFEKTRHNRLYTRILICNTVLLLSDAMAWLFKGSSAGYSSFILHISNFLVFVLGYCLLGFFTDYLVSYISLRMQIPKTAARLMWILCGAAVLLVIISQFNHMYYFIDENNFYQRHGLFWLSQIWGIISMAVDGYLIFRYRAVLKTKEKVALASYIFLPITAMLIQIFVYGVALLYLATTISILWLYMDFQMEQVQKNQKKELELEKSRTKILLSQIEPHFLYNSLAAIGELCCEDPEKAERAVYSFANYLRGNLDFLSNDDMIPFELELAHVKHYLMLEQMRFDERLKVCYEFECLDFKLPALTIQPIVENAVRYGLLKKKEGGTVRIETREYPDHILAIVSDDGVGFDLQEKKNDGRSHIGIENVRNRLQLLCEGTLVLESRIGYGTTAEIMIPKTDVKM